MRKSLLDETLRICLKELDTHPEYKHYMHWSFVVQNNKLLGWSTNRRDGVPPVHLGYQDRINGGQPKLHSEFLAFNKTRGIICKSDGWEVINVRLNRNAEMRKSAPCMCCSSFIAALGCVKCYFTTDSGWDNCKL